MISTDQKSPNQQVFLRRVSLFFGNAVGNVAVAMITAVVTSFIMIDADVPLLSLLIWLMGLIVFVSLVLMIETKFDADELTQANVQRWLNMRMIAGCLVSLMYGLAVFIYPDDVQAHHVMYLVMILIALVALCATGFAVMPVYTYLVSLVTIFPMLLFLLFKGTVFYFGLAFSMLIIWAVLINKARQVSVTAIQALEFNEKLITEIENHEQTQKQLDHMVNHDYLTGLPNRKYLTEQLTKMLQLKQQSKLDFAVMFLDLDGFKKINDERGHVVGDLVLKQVAQTLKNVLSKEQFAARMGGDEFIVLAPVKSEHEPADVNALINTIKTLLSQPIGLSDRDHVIIGVSIGVVHADESHQSAEALIQQADLAMYQKKKAKK